MILRLHKGSSGSESMALRGTPAPPARPRPAQGSSESRPPARSRGRPPGVLAIACARARALQERWTQGGQEAKVLEGGLALLACVWVRGCCVAVFARKPGRARQPVPLRGVAPPPSLRDGGLGATPPSPRAPGSAVAGGAARRRILLLHGVTSMHLPLPRLETRRTLSWRMLLAQLDAKPSIRPAGPASVTPGSYSAAERSSLSLTLSLSPSAHLKGPPAA